MLKQIKILKNIYDEDGTIIFFANEIFDLYYEDKVGVYFITNRKKYGISLEYENVLYKTLES